MRRSPLTLFAIGTALLLPLLFTTVVVAGPWTVRYAFLLLVPAVGLPALLSLLRSERYRRTAALGLAFLGWTILSTVVAPHPVQAVWGILGIGTGAIFVGALVAAWAIGASVDEGAASLIEGALLLAAGINAFVAIAQMAFDLRSLGLGLFDMRSSGLLGNPVFLAELLAASFWLACLRAPTHLGRWAAFALLVGAGLQVSGSRLPLALAFLVIPVALFRVPRQVVAIMTLALVVGLGAGSVVTAKAGGATTATRLTEPVGANGNRARVENWATAGPAIAARPVVGYGPGRYGEATGPHRTMSLAKAGPDRLFFDAHNLVIEYATTTGLPGVLLLLAFLVLAIGRAGRIPPLAGFAYILLAIHLVEPQNVAMTPLAFLALGAAAPAVPRPPPFGPVIARGALVALSLGLAALLLNGSYYFQEGELGFKVDDAQVALRRLPPWPQASSLLARIYIFRSKTERQPALMNDAISWRAEAVRRDPGQPGLWADLGETQLATGQRRAARRSFENSLRWNPWSTRALDDLGAVAVADRRWSDAVAAFEKSLAVTPSQPDVQPLLKRARAELGSQATA